MAAPALEPSTTCKYPPKVVELRDYADSISKRIADLKSKRDSTLAQISAHASSIADAVESACAGSGLEVLEPFAAVAVDEIGRLLSSCCEALSSFEKQPRVRKRLNILAFASRSSRPPSPLPESTTTIDDYRISLGAIEALLRIEDGQSQLVYSGTMAPRAAQTPALLHDEISNSAIVDEVFKNTLKSMANMTEGLPFPCKAVAQTVLQFHEHVESYLGTDHSIRALMSKVDGFVGILTQRSGQKIASGEDVAQAIEMFFRTVQSIIVRLEILKATRPVKKFAAPGAVSAAVAKEKENLDHAHQLLTTALQLNIHNTVHEIRDAQILVKSDVNYSSELPASPKILHGRDEELRSLVDFVIDRSRPIRLAIMGAGGLGKTTLAKAVVQHIDVARTFRDRRFFVSAEAVAGIDELLTGILTTFGLSPTSDALKSLLQDFRSHDQTLLVLDNLETIWNSANAKQRSVTEDVLSKLDRVTSLTLIITCRGTELPPDIEWANRNAVSLSTLTYEAALATFTDIAGDVPAFDRPVRDALLQEVDYMPLAVTLLARLVARGKQLRDLYRRWNSVHTSMLSTQPNGRLDNVDASVQLSIAYLPSDNPAPLHLLSLCAQLPDGMRLPVREELERRCGFRDVEGILDVIQGLALVYVTEDDTIRMLSPIRLHVLEKHAPLADHRASLLGIYYEIGIRAPHEMDTRFYAARDRILPELSNFDALLSSEVQKSDELPSKYLIAVVFAVSDFSSRHVPNERWLTSLRRLLTSLIPRIEHLPLFLAASHSLLARLHRTCDEYDLSLEAATRARSLYQSLGQRSDAAACDRIVADIHRYKGNYSEAIASISAAREIANDLDIEIDVAYCDMELATVLCDQKKYDDAAALFTSTREVFLRLDDPASAVFCQETLGDIHRIRRDYQAAETHLESAIQTYTSLGLMAGVASCSCWLGDVYRFQRRYDAALETLQVAYDIGQKQGDTFRIADSLLFRSLVHRDQGEVAHARRLLLDAQRLYDSVGDSLGLGYCADRLASLDRRENARTRDT